jgi:hypothetical protein
MDTSADQDRYIRVLHLRNRTMTARDTISNVPGLRRISAQTVRNRLRVNVLTLAQYWDVGIDLQDSCCKKNGCTPVYRRQNERFANFGGGSVMMWGAISYAEKLNWCTSTATLAPLDTEMRFWHHTCCSQWTAVGKFFSTTTLGRTQLVLLLTI